MVPQFRGIRKDTPGGGNGSPKKLRIGRARSADQGSSDRVAVQGVYAYLGRERRPHRHRLSRNLTIFDSSETADDKIVLTAIVRVDNRIGR